MWILPRFRCFPSAQGEAGSISDLSWLFQLLASSASLNGTLSPHQSWYKRWKRTPWLQHLSGRISEPSTAARGVAAFIASLPDTPASRSAKPEAVVARMIRDICGPKFSEWCRRYVPPSSFWKMSQVTLDLGLEESSEISEMQATELRRLSSGLRMWAHRTKEKGSSSSAWKTPHGMSYITEGGGGEFAKQTEQWRTPLGSEKDGVDQMLDARRMRHREELRPGGAASTTQELSGQVMQWKTPVVPDGGRHLPPHATETGMVDGVKRQVDLQHQVRTWPTPRGTDAKDAARTTTDRGHEKDPGTATLLDASRSFPQAPAILTPGEESLNDAPNSLQLSAFRNLSASGSGGHLRHVGERLLTRRLNPIFVSYLMGWPLIGGNGSDSLETGSCPWRPRMRSALSRLVSD